MRKEMKEAVSLCNAIKRNGFEAYIINPRMQESLIVGQGTPEIDIATDMSVDDLIRQFNQAIPSREPYIIAELNEKGLFFRFYHSDIVESSHPESTIVRFTERMLDSLDESGRRSISLACSYMPKHQDIYEGFNDFSDGQICFRDFPDETLKRNYLLSIRAMRFAANYHLPIEPNTWMAIVRSARRTLDYLSVNDIMDEWRKVDAENMHSFVRMLMDSQILHGLLPEVAALSRVHFSVEGGRENVLEHTLATMRHYPEELPYDWYGVMALLFHDVGKLYTAEYVGGTWTFSQHPQVGAKITRKILKNLRFDSEDIDLICHLVRYHNRFDPMLTDKGIRRFKALNEYPRIIEMARANIKSRNGSYASFNHNMKIMERADEPEEMLEPLLNGNEIMDFAGLKPGPLVGLLREALLKAQIRGDVTSVPEAVEFVCRYKDKERLST